MPEQLDAHVQAGFEDMARFWDKQMRDDGYAGQYHLLSTPDNVLFAGLKRPGDLSFDDRRKIIDYLKSRYAFLSTNAWMDLQVLDLELKHDTGEVTIVKPFG